MAAQKTSSSGVPAQLIIDLTQTNLPLDTQVYVYVIGMVATTNQFYYLSSDGVPTLMNPSTDNKNSSANGNQLPPDLQSVLSANYPNAWADYSFAVTTPGNLVLDLGAINASTIPGLGTGMAAFSGRVYISVGIPKLPITPVGSGSVADGYIAPVFGNQTGAPGQYTLYDWVEFSYDSEGNFNGNTTQVNQFGIPLTLTGTPVGGAPYPTQGALNVSRSSILSAFAQAPAPFGGSGVVVTPPAGSQGAYPPGIEYLRAISPLTISSVPSLEGPFNTYFDAVINTAYTAWQSTPLVTHDLSTGYYTGIVPTTGPNEGSLVFYQGNYPTLPLPKGVSPAFVLGQIQTLDVWQCANTLASGGTAQQNVGKMIAAAFNRGVVVNPTTKGVITSLDDATCSSESGTFYPSGGTFNPWAQIFHQDSTNGLAYGFPYDDVCEQNPSIPPPGDTLVAAFVRITLGQF